MNNLIPFAHRRNPDASIDSICTKCFQTIASEDSESSLIAHEETGTSLCSQRSPTFSHSPLSFFGFFLAMSTSAWAFTDSIGSLSATSFSGRPSYLEF
jgi:hypothetical protein